MRAKNLLVKGCSCLAQLLVKGKRAEMQTAVMQIDKIKELIGGKVYVTPALKAADGGTDSALLMETETENANLVWLRT